MNDRVILHCDCNSFYASVELLDYPELRDRPVAVAGSEDDRHGIILAKNEAAKKYKIQTAETVWQAKQKCPELILLPPHGKKYRKYSRITNEIYESYTDRVEPFGIDESWLDLTGSWQLFGKSPYEVAEKLRKQVWHQTGLTISIGVSFNKIFAKLGSDYKKPNATTEISRNDYKQLLWPLHVSKLLFVGRRVAEILADLGVHTIGQLAACDEELLKQVLGKQGPQLRHSARGEDYSPVAKTGESEPVKSIGNGLTFRRNLVGHKDIRTGIGSLSGSVAVRLRQQKLYATSLQVLIKDADLKSISRQKPLPFATNLAKDLTNAAMELLRDNWDFSRPIRMLTLTAQHLTNMPFATQTSLFGEAPGIDLRRESLEKSMDEIREKYGKTAIMEASNLHNDIGLNSRAEISEKEDDETDEQWSDTQLPQGK